MRLRLIPNEPRFFALIEEQASSLYAGSTLLLNRLVPSTAKDAAPATSATISESVHRSEMLLHDMVLLLNKTFVTPLDREDLYALTRALDDVLGLVGTSAERLDVFQIEAPTAYMVELSRIIVRCSEEIRQGVFLLRHLRHGEPLMRLCTKIQGLENDADRVLHDALSALFQEHRADPLEVIKWKDIYENLEMATDRCADVADILQNVVVKYT
jgi:hypothetical protein